MEIQNKIWGQRWLIRKDSTSAVSYLSLKKGFRCSWHRHREKFNLFVVLEGKVRIVTEELDRIKREIVLEPGQIFTTRPGQWHEFQVIEDSKMVEIMYVEYHESDIERKLVGSQMLPPYDRSAVDG